MPQILTRTRLTERYFPTWRQPSKRTLTWTTATASATSKSTTRERPSSGRDLKSHIRKQCAKRVKLKKKATSSSLRGCSSPPSLLRITSKASTPCGATPKPSSGCTFTSPFPLPSFHFHCHYLTILCRGKPPCKTLEESRELLAFCLPSPGNEEIDKYAVFLKDAAEPRGMIGFVGTNRWSAEGLGMEVGYCFNSAYWGRGYATEGFMGFLSYYWTLPGIDLVTTFLTSPLLRVSCSSQN